MRKLTTEVDAILTSNDQAHILYDRFMLDVNRAIMRANNVAGSLDTNDIRAPDLQNTMRAAVSLHTMNVDHDVYINTDDGTAGGFLEVIEDLVSDYQHELFDLSMRDTLLLYAAKQLHDRYSVVFGGW